MADLRDCLDSEAITAGALGPSEASRIEDRHLGDSIIYASAWDSAPTECWDLGAGAGLPGLVLAVLWPTCRLTLIDRSVRRIELARRGALVVGVEVDTKVTGIEDLQGSVEAIVSRAAVPAESLRPHLARLLAPGGQAVVSGTGDPVSGYRNMDVPDGILDHSARLLIMRAE
jgi:16S rRNA (guanine527-N7)-methyltransferase